jgi:hypothetical protein
MLAVVNYDERPPPSQETNRGVEMGLAGQRPDADAASKRRRHHPRIGERRELEPKDAAGETGVDLADQLHCQRCLATPAHARKRQQPRRGRVPELL